MTITCLLISPRNPVFKKKENMDFMVGRACQTANVVLYPITSQQQKSSLVADTAILNGRIDRLKEFLTAVKKAVKETYSPAFLIGSINQLIIDYNEIIFHDNHKKARDKNSPKIKEQYRRLQSNPDFLSSPLLPAETLTPSPVTDRLREIERDIFDRALPTAIVAQHAGSKCVIYKLGNPPDEKTHETLGIDIIYIPDIQAFAQKILACEKSGVKAHFLFPIHNAADIVARIKKPSISKEKLVSNFEANKRNNAGLKKLVADRARMEVKDAIRLRMGIKTKGKTLEVLAKELVCPCFTDEKSDDASLATIKDACLTTVSTSITKIVECMQESNEFYFANEFPELLSLRTVGSLCYPGSQEVFTINEAMCLTEKDVSTKLYEVVDVTPPPSPPVPPTFMLTANVTTAGKPQNGLQPTFHNNLASLKITREEAKKLGYSEDLDRRTASDIHQRFTR